MPELKMISPLLDRIIAGDAISDHNGIRCYPAMNEDTKEKYIIKVISVPSSQTQLDALLLTGALKSEADAKKYFEDRAKELVTEIEVLQLLSRQEGFLPCVGYQIAEKTDTVGYDIYILTEYRRSLERQFTKKPLSQLDAVNLGLDLCSALSACRRNGYLFVNLKPSNIYVSENGEYRIADLGFVTLNSLKYAILSNNYIGAYTAPEIEDAFSPLNETLDVYALGLILYQIYNGGTMPEKTGLAAPAYADTELSEIIMKAISARPEDRWESPAQMGQMLVSYMQKNGISDLPIVPPAPEPEPEPEPIEAKPTAETVGEEISVSEMIEIIDTIDEVSEVTNDVPADEAVEEPAEATEAADIAPASEETENAPDPIATKEPIQAPEAEVIIVEQLSLLDQELYPLPETEAKTDNSDIEETPAEIAEAAIDADDEVIEPEEIFSPVEEKVAVQESVQEAAPPIVVPVEDLPVVDAASAPAASDYDGLSDEVTQMLSQADELAELSVPEPVVAPEPVEISLSEETEEVSEDQVEETQPENTEDTKPMKRDDYFSDEYFSDDQPKRNSHWLRNTIIILVLLLTLLGGFLFYRFYVLKTVTQFQLSDSSDTLTVLVASDAKEGDLYVSFTDPQMVTTSIPVVDGKVEISKLSPSTKYSVTLNISGLHVLKGNTQAEYTTPAETTIVNYEVQVGQNQGAVDISFAVNGPESDRWSFTYEAPGIAPETVEFVGYSFSLKGLKQNVIYTGVLKPEKNLLITEPLEIVFSASELIQAKDLRIISCSGGTLAAQWQAPESVEVESWSARCYNENYDETQYDLKTTNAVFTGLNSSESFTVEVWAKGQTVRQSVKIEDNSITVKDLSADLAATGRITLTWKTSAAPQSGWIVSYTVDGSETVFERSVTENKAVIDPVAPGAKYTFTVKATDPSTTTFCDSFTCTVPDIEGKFSMTLNERAISADNIQISMCKRPSTGAWSASDLTPDHYTQNFGVGESAAFLFFLKDEFEEADQILNIVITVTDESGNLVSISSQTDTWNSMWNQNYYSLNLGETPRKIGCYTATIYINNMYLAEYDFAIS